MGAEGEFVEKLKAVRLIFADIHHGGLGRRPGFVKLVFAAEKRLKARAGRPGRQPGSPATVDNHPGFHNRLVAEHHLRRRRNLACFVETKPTAATIQTFAIGECRGRRTEAVGGDRRIAKLNPAGHPWKGDAVGRPAEINQRPQPIPGLWWHIRFVKRPGVVAAERRRSLDQEHTGVWPVVRERMHQQTALQSPAHDNVVVWFCRHHAAPPS